MAKRPKVIRPSLGWFALLDGGIVALTMLATSESAHQKVSEAVPVALPPRSALKGLLAATAVTHLAEACAAGRMAGRRGLKRRGWALQTFVVGFPSLLQLRRIPTA